MVAFEEVTKPRGGTVEERGENPNKSFRVFIRLCPEEQRDPPSDEARGFIKVKRPNQVVVDTGRTVQILKEVGREQKHELFGRELGWSKNVDLLEVLMDQGHPSQTLEFNAVWDETATQKEVYESAAKPLVESLLQGHNGCVITYSSPASGRSSHSLLGDGGIAGAQRGIVSRAAEDIFSSPEALNCKIRVSFIQVSNEKIYDLLESQSAEVCRIREGGGAVLLEGLTEVEVGSPQGVLQLYRRGAGNRQSGASRGEFAGKSHIIFNITIAMQMPKATSGQEGLLTTCKLTLVDLTSSAKVPARCGPVPDVRRGLQATPENAQEVKMLKRSLTIFGNVIFALSTAGREHVPYRESKLTRILRDCLGGDCRTSLIVTVSPNPTCVSEALSSLQFARRAMAVPKRQRRCSPLQVRGTKAAEKPKSGHCRRATQRAALTGKRVHPQTCLPPIQHMLVPPSGNGWKRCDEPDHKVVLPQLDVGGTQAMRSAKAARPGEERGAATPPLSTDCPSCNRERKIRQEYDRYIVQARRDRDALSQRVQELEARLQRREKAEPPCSSGSPGAWGAAGTQTGEAANISEGLFSSGGFALSLRYDIASQGGALQGADCPAGSKGSGGQAEEDRENERLPILQGEPEALQDQWGEYSGREEELARQLQEETDPAVLEAQDLRALLEKDQLQLHSLERQKENLSLELEDVRVKYAIFQEEAALVMADLQREKDDLLSQIEERGKSYEKVAMENMDLKVKMDALLGKVGPGGPPDPRSPHRLTTSTELVVLSHHVSHCYSKTQYPDYCIQSAAGIADENTVTSDSDGNPLATKEIFRQLRREHSLLRDVMLILYRRRWFVDDAVPYVRRTLRKCGAKLGPPD